MTRTNVTQAADALGFRQAHVGVRIVEVREDVAATAKPAVELPSTRAFAACGSAPSSGLATSDTI